jgi:hypothetical protein
MAFPPISSIQMGSTAGETLTVCTTVVLGTLSARIARHVLFYCLPVQSKPCQFLFPGGQQSVPKTFAEGQLLSVAEDGIARGARDTGVLFTHRGCYLHNCVSLYVQACGRPVNVKLSSNTMHICGLRSDAEVRAVSTLVMEHVNRLSHDILLVQALAPGVAERTIAHAIERFRGPATTINVIGVTEVHVPALTWRRDVAIAASKARPAKILHTSRAPADEVTVTIRRDGCAEDTINVRAEALRWLRQQPGVECQIDATRGTSLIYEEPTKSVEPRRDHHILPEPTGPLPVPPGVDATLLALLRRAALPGMYHGAWAELCPRLVTMIREVEEPNPRLLYVSSSMARGGTAIPFRINRVRLREGFEEAGFLATFDSTRHSYVRINIPYTPQDEERIRRRKKTHTVLFRVYMSGKLIVTGPSQSINTKAFETFIRVAMALRSRVEDVHTTCRMARKRRVFSPNIRNRNSGQYDHSNDQASYQGGQSRSLATHTPSGSAVGTNAL